MGPSTQVFELSLNIVMADWISNTRKMMQIGVDHFARLYHIMILKKSEAIYHHIPKKP